MPSRARDDLLQRLEALFPAVVSDMLDAIGLRSQVMSPNVRPLFPTARVVGAAATVHAVPSDEIPDAREDQYKHQLEAIEGLDPGEVVVASHVEVSFWGELLSIAARNRGARGVVVDGYVRDVSGIERLGFPVFCTGVSAADALGRSDVIDYAEPIVSGGVAVNPGDLILGDSDGVVVVPLEAADEVLSRAEEKATGENLVRKEIEQGASVRAVFQRYGIL